jgi:23S rRNA (cytidine1920-2'-O)/16S rRNA (cytidine1409-2'-O)-methyltransferase
MTKNNIPKPSKIRLDSLLVQKGLTQSRERAKALIMAGKVLVNQTLVDKPGKLIPENDQISLKEKESPYVSRGGLKLAKALQTFEIDVQNAICMDVGASTGGFTDCLLQNGAARVYAIDVGYGQLDWKLRNDSRVIPFERTNVRHMEVDALPEKAEIVTIDVSFISLKIVVPAIMKFTLDNATIICLIKPQFEVGKGKVGKGGIVRDPELHKTVITDLTQFFEQQCLDPINTIPSPILGPKGNKEFLIHLSRTKQTRKMQG